MKELVSLEANKDYSYALQSFQQRVGYIFKDTTLLLRATRHIARFERIAGELSRIKSLETIGDGIVNREMEKIFPDDMKSGYLPAHFNKSNKESVRHFFQSNAYLSLCALWLQLDSVIRMPYASQTNQETERKIRHLANTFERFVGAVSVDDATFTSSLTRMRKLLFPEGLSTPLVKAVALCCTDHPSDHVAGLQQLTGDPNASISFFDGPVDGKRIRYVTFTAGGREHTYEQRGNTFLPPVMFVRSFLIHFITEYPEFLWQYAGLGSGRVSIVYPFAERVTTNDEK